MRSSRRNHGLEPRRRHGPNGLGAWLDFAPPIFEHEMPITPDGSVGISRAHILIRMRIAACSISAQSRMKVSDGRRRAPRQYMTRRSITALFTAANSRAWELYRSTVNMSRSDSSPRRPRTGQPPRRRDKTLTMRAIADDADATRCR